MNTTISSSADEARRMAAVRRFDILDTPPDGSFDRITALAAQLFDVPIALVTIVDEDRIWFKSRYGLPDVQEIGRDPGLCASAIIGDGPYIVEDARLDPRTLANPLVAGQFGLRFYAAAPLRLESGEKLGNLCIIDKEPRIFSPGQGEILQKLSEIVVDEMELRISALSAIRQAQSAPPL